MSVDNSNYEISDGNLDDGINTIFQKPGVDVIITSCAIFANFRRKKIALFPKINDMINILHNLPFILSKNANF
jgi:hypothetical protein